MTMEKKIKIGLVYLIVAGIVLSSGCVQEQRKVNNVKITGTIILEDSEEYYPNEMLTDIMVEVGIGETPTEYVCAPMNTLANSKSVWTDGTGTYEIEFKIDKKIEVVVSAMDCSCKKITIEPNREYVVDLEIPADCPG